MNKKILGSALAMTLLAVLTALFFWPAIFSSGQFFFGDISQNHYPARKLISLLIEEGRVPLWNPYITGGQPLYANPNNLLFHPVSLLFLFFPFDAAFKSSIILQFFLCAIGMYLFSKELGFSPSASLLSSMALTFSGFFLSMGHLYNLLSAAAWIPFYLFFFYRSIYRSLFYWPLSSLFLVIIFMGADPFFIGVSLLLSFSLLLWKPGRKKLFDPILKKLGSALLIIISAIFLSSFFLLPSFEMFLYSERGRALSSDMIGKWSLRGREMLELFIPHIFGNPLRLPTSDYWGHFVFPEGHPLFLSLYMSIIVLFLSLATFFKRGRVVLLLWSLLIISIFFSLGPNNPIVPSAFWTIPILSSFRYTSKLFLLSTFCLSLLAGKGFDDLIFFRSEDHRNKQYGSVLLLLTSLMTFFLAAFYYVGLLFPKFLQGLLEILLNTTSHFPEVIFRSISSKFLSSVIYASGMGLMGTLLILVSLYFRMRKSVMVWLFLSVIFCDLYIANRGLNPIAKSNFYEERSPFIAELSKEKSLRRIYRERAPEDLMLKTSEGWKEEGFFWNRMVLLQWTSLPDRLLFAFDQNVDRLEPYRPILLMKKAKQKGWGIWKKILDMSSVASLILFRKVKDPDLSMIMEYSTMSNHPVVLYRNRSAFPRIYAVSKVRIVSSEGEALREVLSEAFQPKEEAIVLLNTKERLEWTKLLVPSLPLVDNHDRAKVKERDSEGGSSENFYRIRLKERTNNYLKISIQADQPGFLVFTDTYYPGWICRLDGHESSIYRTNFIHQGVPFEKGPHLIEFQFRPKIFYGGIVLSIISFIAILIFMSYFMRRKRS